MKRNLVLLNSIYCKKMVRRNSLLKSFFMRPSSPVSSSSGEETSTQRRDRINLMDVDIVEPTQPTQLTSSAASNTRNNGRTINKRLRLKRSASVSAIDGISTSEEFRTRQYVEISDEQLDCTGENDDEHEKYMKWATEMLKANHDTQMSIDQPTTSRGRTTIKAPIKRRFSRRRATISPEVVDMNDNHSFQPQASKKKRGRPLKKTEGNSASKK
jgi:hypothetical protein